MFSCGDDNKFWVEHSNPVANLIIRIAGELDENNTYHQTLIQEADRILGEMSKVK